MTDKLKLCYINTMNEELEKRRSVVRGDLDRLEKKIDKLQSSFDKLNGNLEKHIDFIGKTYEGLKNPIEGVKRFLGRR